MFLSINFNCILQPDPVNVLLSKAEAIPYHNKINNEEGGSQKVKEEITIFGGD